MIPLPPQELGGRHLAELLQAGDIEINVDPKYPQALGISQIFGLVAAFGNFEWDVLLNRFEDSPFFTSDYPIAIEQGDDPRLVNRIVPLAPNLAVRIKPNFKVDRRRADFSCKHFRCRMRTASRKEVAAINRAIVQCAEDAIFYRDNLLWVPKFIARNRHYRIEQITHRLPAENGSLLITTHKIMNATR